MLNEICKKDKYWRTIAFAICKDKDLADDLVQDMYVKLHNVKLDRIMFNETEVFNHTHSVFCSVSFIQIF